MDNYKQQYVEEKNKKIDKKIKDLINWLVKEGQVAEKIDAYSVILSYGVLTDNLKLNDIVSTAKEEMKVNKDLYKEAEMSLKPNPKLWKQAMDKAKRERNEWMTDQISYMNPKKLSRSDIDMLEDFLMM